MQCSATHTLYAFWEVMLCSLYFPALGNDICLRIIQDDRMKCLEVCLHCLLLVVLKRETNFVKQAEGRACFTGRMMWNFGAWSCVLFTSGYYILIYYVIIHFKCERIKCVYIFINEKFWWPILGSQLRNHFIRHLQLENVFHWQDLEVWEDLLLWNIMIILILR